MLDLANTCLLDGRKYITSIKGGKQISPEGLDHGMSIVFVVEFAVSL